MTAAEVQTQLSEAAAYLAELEAERDAARARAEEGRGKVSRAVGARTAPAELKALSAQATEAEAESIGLGGAIEAQTRLVTRLRAELTAAQAQEATSDAERLRGEAEAAVAQLGASLQRILRNRFLPELRNVETLVEQARDAEVEAASMTGRVIYPGGGRLWNVWSHAPGLEPMLRTLTEYAEGVPLQEAAKARQEQERRKEEDRLRAEREREAQEAARQYLQRPVEERNRQALQSLGVNR